MSVFNSWRDAVADVLAAGFSASRPPQFDEMARFTDVAKQVSEARRYPLWPVGLAALLLLLPNGWIFALLAGAMWAFTVRAAVSRSSTLQSRLDAETTKLREATSREAEAVTQALMRANEGDIAGLEYLLKRWLDRRPECIRTFTAQIADGRSGEFVISGDAIRRDMIPAGMPRIGRGGRIVQDKRSAAAIDEDLTELNALAVLSLLFAVVNIPTRQRLLVRMTMQTDSGAIPWITLQQEIGARELDQIPTALPTLRPSDWIRRLGGGVGECRRQRLSPACEAMPAATSVSAPVVMTVTPTSVGAPPPAITRAPAPITLPAGSTNTSGSGQAVPPPPTKLSTGWPDTNDLEAVPTPATVHGPFSAVARRFAEYRGDPDAMFTPFDSYWPTYDRMAAGQLKFYFKWRTCARTGDQTRTDLAYIFVHIYELLHVIGATGASDAAKQLDGLWTGYRGTFPKLDNYCSRWLIDLYASVGRSAEVFSTTARALELGATVSDDEALVLTDRLWSAGDYIAMPRRAVCTLAADSRFGTTKFYAQYNEGGWIDRAYREALRIADEAYRAKFGRGLRDATLQECGVRVVARDPFGSAVYDWQRKPVVLGTVPRLTSECTAVQVYRNATAYAENLLRAEKGFKSKLRGVEVGPTLGAALDAFFGRYVAATRRRAKVVIDAAKAEQLAADSAAARARLLAGLEDHADGEPAATPLARLSATEGACDRPDPAERIPDGLLTDLAPIVDAISTAAVPTRALLDVLIDAGWELALSDERVQAAAAGVLLGPLIDDLNNRLRGRISGALLVVENGAVVVQEDYRDEVFWACRGTLAGFVGKVSTAPGSRIAQPIPATAADSVEHGFSLTEIRALELIFRGGASVTNQLAALASANATTPLIVVDRINEVGLASPYGDLLIDTAAAPPAIMDDAMSYVSSLVSAPAAR